MEKSSSNINSKSTSQFVRGWSWGDIKVNENQIQFEVNNQNWFNIPHSGISNALLPTKNEIGLEFNLEEEDTR
jgi:structure-specific recognition protein 1